jgi:metal-sulfur cluster biosynthetic enzyme
MSALVARVYEALHAVIDPCSVSAGTPISVVDMGMVTDVSADESGAVAIVMRPTSAMCTMIAGIMKGVEEHIGRVEGVSRVDVMLLGGQLWTEEDMSERGRAVLAARRERARREIAVRPHEWKTRAPRAELLRAVESEAQ